MKQKRGQKFKRDLGVFLRLYDENGSLVISCTKNASLLNSCAGFVEKQWNKGVKVSIVYQRGVENSGTFHNKTQILNFLRVCLEPDLVEYCTGAGW